MQYMLLIYLEEQAMSETEREHCYVESASSRNSSMPADSIWRLPRSTL